LYTIEEKSYSVRILKIVDIYSIYQGSCMPVPKRKRSRARRDSRFANKGIKAKAIASCKNCQEALAPHQACHACGYYKGVKVLTPKSERVQKRSERRKAQQEAQQAAQSTPTE
jgi:large subunit ribosomal protein L32